MSRKSATEYKNEQEEKFKDYASLPLYCDNKKGIFRRRICGGQLYNVYGDRVATYRFNKDRQFIYARCRRCDKSYNLPLPMEQK